MVTTICSGIDVADCAAADAAHTPTTTDSAPMDQGFLRIIRGVIRGLAPSRSYLRDVRFSATMGVPHGPRDLARMHALDQMGLDVLHAGRQIDRDQAGPGARRDPPEIGPADRLGAVPGGALEQPRWRDPRREMVQRR